MDLNTIWFGLIGVLFSGYALLDGFDLGVGVLSLFSRNEKERDAHVKAIAPVWDGNEVWLLTGGGALFAAFPIVYAVVFSGFYLALMLVLFALILRAVSIEFRYHIVSETARTLWGWVFGISSLLVSILLGVAFGNILRGIPINESGAFTGTFLGLLNPFSLLMGFLSLSFFVMHGAAYMALKTDGDLQQRMFKTGTCAVGTASLLYCTVIAALYFVSPFFFSGNPLYWLAILLTFAGFFLAWNGTRRNKGLIAFCGSALSIISFIATAAIALFPRMVPSITNLDYSLTAYNASSTPRTLTVMLIIALAGMPVVIAYTSVIYWIFKGKASDEQH